MQHVIDMSRFKRTAILARRAMSRGNTVVTARCEPSYHDSDGNDGFIVEINTVWTKER